MLDRDDGIAPNIFVAVPLPLPLENEVIRHLKALKKKDSIQHVPLLMAEVEAEILTTCFFAYVPCH
jgi:hypothetical protein